MTNNLINKRARASSIRALRHALRLDPDVIVPGEVRNDPSPDTRVKSITIEDPPEWHPRPQGAEKALCDEYAAWNAAQGLNLGSADEHIHDPALTDAQRAWLRDFLCRWEEWETAVRNHHDALRMSK